MWHLLKILLPVFLTPANYAEMRKKLGLFLEVWLVTFILRTIPGVDSAFRVVESGSLGNALSLIPGHEKLNLAGFAVAIAVAGISFAIQLHDRISDLLPPATLARADEVIE